MNTALNDIVRNNTLSPARVANALDSDRRATASGTDTYTATLSPAITSYVGLETVHILFTNANTGAATLALNGLAALPIRKNGSTSLSSGDISAGQILLLGYDGTNLQILGGGGSPGGSGTVESVTGENNAVDNTDPDNPIVRNSVRTVTGADASVIADNNGLVIFNSATPFDFTLDQLAQWTKIAFMNIGAGEVTFINGSGVTLTGDDTLSGAVGTVYPTAVVVYMTLTTPKVVQGSIIGVTSKTVTNGATGSTNIDCELEEEMKVLYDTTVTGNITITKSNDSNLEVLHILAQFTGTSITITFPSDTRMARYNESTSGLGWNQSTKVLTVSAVGTADWFEFSLVKADSIFLLVYDGPTRA